MLPLEHTIVPNVIERQELVTVGADMSVRAAAALMAERNIGALLIVEGRRLAGIFTERDLLTRVVASGRDPDGTTVGEVMTRDPDVLHVDDAVVTALDMMNQRGYRHLPVVDGDDLIGLVSVHYLFRSVKDQLEADIILLAEALIQG